MESGGRADVGQQRKALAMVHLAVLLFGLSGLFGKLLSLSPLIIVYGRTAWASVILVLILIMGDRWRPPDPRDRVLLLVSGALLTAHWYTFFESIRVSSVAVGLVSFSSFPLFVSFLEPHFFKETMKPRDLVSAALVVVGLLLVVPAYSFANQVTLGAFWGVCSGASFAVLALMNRRFSQRKHASALSIAAVQNSLATLLLLPFVWQRGIHFQAYDFLYLMILGIVCTALAHALFISGLSRIRAQTASVLAGLEPVYGVGFAFLLLGERPALRTLVGGGVILTAVFMASLMRTQSDPTD